MKTAGVLALALGLPAAALAQPAPQSADELFAKGVQLHQAGDILGAVEAYQEALQKDPARVDARSNLGAAYVRLGRYEDAIREYRRALETLPSHAGVRFNLALALYKSAQVSEAATELEKVVAAEPEQKAARLLLADCRLQEGDEAAVLALLEPYEATLGKDPLYCYLMGTVLLRRNELLRGQVFIDRLFKDGDTAPARLLMGLAHLRRKDARSAIPELERAIALDPHLATVHSVHGRALMDAGRRQEAAEAFRLELANNPNDFDANLYLGLLLKEEDRLDDAYDHLKRAGRLRPNDARVLYGLGGVHLAAGRVDEAQQALEAVTAAVPEYTQAHVLLATVYYRQKKKELGDHERAIAEKLRQERQEQEAGASDTLGPAYKGEEMPPGKAGPGGPKDKEPPAPKESRPR
jgi:tetratricopeptide (TPR) repeat protein